MLNLLKILQTVPELLLTKFIVIWNRKINIRKQFLCYTKSQNQSLYRCDATRNKTLFTPLLLFMSDKILGYVIESLLKYLQH